MSDPIRDALERLVNTSEVRDWELNDREWHVAMCYARNVLADTPRAAMADQPPADALPPAPVADPIRAELEALVAFHDEHGGRWPEEDERALAGAVERARAALAAPPPAPACDGKQNVHRELAQWLEQHRQPAPPPAPAPIDIDALLSPEGAYEPGTGQEDGAQLVDQLEWWAPQHGCETLDNLLDRLRARILPYLRPPVAGIDVPGPDGDYGGLQELCDAEGVDVRIGAPLLKRAREAWKVAAQPPAPTPAPSLDADTLRKVWREAAWGGRWVTLSDYVALAVEAQRAPSGNPPATEEYLAEARQEVAGFSNELLARRLQNLARVQARDGREYSSAMCARAAELITPASDGEREKQAQVQQEGVRRG